MTDQTQATGWTFAQIPIWLIANSEISDGAKVLFSYLKYRQGTDVSCWPSKWTIAFDLGVSEATIDRRLKELYGSGYVVRHERSGRSNLYELKAAPSGHPESWIVKESERKFEQHKRHGGTVPPLKSDTPQGYKNDPPPPLKNDTHDDSHEQQKRTREECATAQPPHEPAPPRSRKKSDRDERMDGLVQAFCDVSGLSPPALNTEKQKRAAGALWFGPLAAMAKTCDNDVDRTGRLMKFVIEAMDGDGMTISTPKSIQKSAIAEQARRKRNGTNGKLAGGRNDSKTQYSKFSATTPELRAATFATLANCGAGPGGS